MRTRSRWAKRKAGVMRPIASSQRRACRLGPRMLVLGVVLQESIYRRHRKLLPRPSKKSSSRELSPARPGTWPYQSTNSPCSLTGFNIRTRTPRGALASPSRLMATTRELPSLPGGDPRWPPAGRWPPGGAIGAQMLSVSLCRSRVCWPSPRRKISTPRQKTPCSPIGPRTRTRDCLR